MADNVKGITVLTEFLDGLVMLSDEQRGRLFLALFADSGACDMPEMDTMTRMVFKLIIPTVRRFQDSYARHAAARAENGKKGGRPRKQNQNLETEGETKKAIGFSENQQDNLETEGETKKAERNGTETEGIGKDPTSLTTSLQDTQPAPARTRHFRVPTVAEVQAYCDERQNGIDGQVFVDFYQARGWMIGKTKMKDWRAAVRTWEQKRKQEEPEWQIPDWVR